MNPKKEGVAFDEVDAAEALQEAFDFGLQVLFEQNVQKLLDDSEAEFLGLCRKLFDSRSLKCTVRLEGRRRSRPAFAEAGWKARLPSRGRRIRDIPCTTTH